jgi:hypothetical protein
MTVLIKISKIATTKLLQFQKRDVQKILTITVLELGFDTQSSVIAFIDNPDDLLEKITTEDFTNYPLIIISQNSPNEELTMKIQINQMVFLYNTTTQIQTEVYSINDIQIVNPISHIMDGKFHSGHFLA